MKLYELDQRVQELLETGLVIDEETGEILFDEENFDELLQDRDSKWESVALFIKNTLATAEAIKEEEKKLKERRQAEEKRVERLTDYLSKSMLATGDTKFETPKVSLSFRKSTKVSIDDEDLVPAEYKKTKIEVTCDKTAIKRAMAKDGVIIEGARLIDCQNLQIK